MKKLVLGFALAAMFAAGPLRVSASMPSGGGVAWQAVSSDAEVDKAFALAKQSGKPVFLYWGAVWCPPCNQVKATLFSRADFVERSRAFVPVYVDGDKPGAQKVASRFKVSGYPTMIVFKADGVEITRLPGEVDPQRYLLTLTSALDAQVPVKELVRRGLAHQALSPEQWRLLAFYSWDTDEQQVLKTSELAQALAGLSAAAPSDLPRVRERLAFKALLARAKSDAKPDAATLGTDRRVAEAIRVNAAGAHELEDLVAYYSADVVEYLAPDATDRPALAAQWEQALSQVVARDSMSRGMRIDAMDTRVALWKMQDGGKLSSAHRDQVLREIAEVVSRTSDRYERQAVVPSAAHVLTAAGLLNESDQMLRAELPRAVAPYYHMLGLASNAKSRGDAKAALQWYEQAWTKAEGPATRLQWGASYVTNVVDLTPNDIARVQASALGVVSQLRPDAETFYERNERSLKKLAAKLTQWQGSDPARTSVVSKVKMRLAATCGKLRRADRGRENCDAVFADAHT